MTNNKLLTKLYLISPAYIIVNEFAKSLELVLKTGLVYCFQLRLKNIEDNFIVSASKKLIPICKKYNVPFILNDRFDLANEVGADGVHLGENDGNIIEARKLLGANAIIGASCYNSKHLAMEAAEKGADYVAFGAFFDTQTKIPKSKAEIDTVKDWVYISNIPCVAIGGINSLNCKELVKAGVDLIAVIGCVWSNKETPEIAIKQFENILI